MQAQFWRKLFASRFVFLATALIVTLLLACTVESHAFHLRWRRLDTSVMSADLMNAVNHVRQQHGKPTLCTNSKLSRASQTMANDMAETDYFAATGIDHSSPAERVSSQHFVFTTLTEDVAAGYENARDAVEALMREQEHRDNILGEFRFVGVGYAHGRQGFQHYWALHFANAIGESCDEDAEISTARMLRTLSICMLPFTCFNLRMLDAAPLLRYRETEPKAIVAELVDVVNDVRHRHGLRPVCTNSKLMTASAILASDMAWTDFFRDTGDDFSSPAERVSTEGFRFTTLLEDVAAGYETPRAAARTMLPATLRRAARRQSTRRLPQAATAAVAAMSSSLSAAATASAATSDNTTRTEWKRRIDVGPQLADFLRSSQRSNESITPEHKPRQESLEQIQRILEEIDRAEAVPVPRQFVDRFGRAHTYLRISLTERCNLRCRYCMPEEGVPLQPHDDLLSTAEIIRLAKLFAASGVNRIRLTGGEPLLRRDLVDLVAQLRSIPGINSVGITTNGIVLQKKLAALQRAGVDRLNISLDTLRPDRFTQITRRQGFQRVMDAIRDAQTMNFAPLKINCVVMRDVNLDEILDFVAFTEHNAVDVRFIEWMPFDSNKWNDTTFVSFDEMMTRIRHKYPTIEKLADDANDTSKAFHIPGFRGQFGFITSMSQHFCGTCNRMRLTADGNLKVVRSGARIQVSDEQTDRHAIATTSAVTAAATITASVTATTIAATVAVTAATVAVAATTARAAATTAAVASTARTAAAAAALAATTAVTVTTAVVSTVCAVTALALPVTATLTRRRRPRLELLLLLRGLRDRLRLEGGEADAERRPMVLVERRAVEIESAGAREGGREMTVAEGAKRRRW
ncbi:hypothetical protein ATCC90586_000352 [Pythium insidiosum]|nr:hypothetical protein ATCC90586_000352 [Pythium insidiosum]